MRMKFSLILTGFLLIIAVVAGCGTDPGKNTGSGPTVPKDLTATVVGSGQIDLSWTASTDDKGVTGYYIYSGDTQVADVTTATYSRSGLSPDTEYCHTVKAYDADGNVSDASSQVCAKTQQKKDVTQLINEAKAALENQDIKTAKEKFEEAYAGDSTNKDANFGVAITKGIMLLEDPDVINIIKKWGGYAPKVENVVYGILGDTFEVYGGNSPYCGTDLTDITENSYTKLSTTDTASPFTYSGSYNYYLIYVPGFSQIQVDAVNAGGNVNSAYCISGRTDGVYLGGTSDGIVRTIGENAFTGSAMTIKANSGATSITITASKLGGKIGIFTTSNGGYITEYGSGSGSIGSSNDFETDYESDNSDSDLFLSRVNSVNEDTDPVNQFKGLVGKLPKNRVSLLKKVRIAVGRTIYPTAPTVSEMQAVIDNKILPVVDDMIKKMRTVEGTDYTFTITPSMTGDAEANNTVLDDGDFYAFDAGLNGIMALLDIVTAYNLDVDYDIIEADPLSAINGPSGGLTSSLDSSEFFTLKSSGTTKMINALSALKDAVVYLDKSYNFVINSDPDPFTDNGINFKGMSEEEREEFKNWIKFGTNAMSSPADFPLERGDDGISFTGDDKYLKLDLSKFFTAPLDRTDLPKLGYDFPINGTLSQEHNSPVHKVVGNEVIDSDIWLTSDFPDRTFNGVFPNGIPDSDANLYLNKAILLPQEAWWGDDWNANIARGGDGNITLRKGAWNYETWDTEVKLFNINPSDGSLLGTKSATMSSGPNSINWINQRVWHEDKMWGSGGYYDENSWLNDGVFSIDPLDIGIANNQIPLDFNNFSPGGIASDGTNLYLGIGKWEWDWDETFTGGVVKFQTNVSEIPTTPLLVSTGDTPYYVTFGDGYLWVSDFNSILKVNPATGGIVNRYDGPWDAPQMYYDGSLWSVQGKKLISLIAP